MSATLNEELMRNEEPNLDVRHKKERRDKPELTSLESTTENDFHNNAQLSNELSETKLSYCLEIQRCKDEEKCSLEKFHSQQQAIRKLECRSDDSETCDEIYATKVDREVQTSIDLLSDDSSILLNEINERCRLTSVITDHPEITNDLLIQIEHLKERDIDRLKEISELQTKIKNLENLCLQKEADVYPNSQVVNMLSILLRTYYRVK